ncbi:MAG: hypothetical protein H6561_19340 [Lewinellaceae bacterium]|nr:hypothetical protein [Lewinellaceae bacterium]
MAFIVKPDQEGYDLDWLKAHIDFDETSQFILKNDKTEKGFSAQLAGKISLKMNLIEGQMPQEMQELQPLNCQESDLRVWS